MSCIRGGFGTVVICWCLAMAAQTNTRTAAHSPAQRKSTSPLLQQGTQGDLRRVQKYAPGELLVRFRRGVTKGAAQQAHAQVGAQVLRKFRLVEDLQLVQLPAGMKVRDARRYYRQRADVLYAEPNYYRFADQSPITPNDPRFTEMWNLHNTGQTGGTAGADIHAPEAWSRSTGSATVVVGIIDTGVDYTHPDLAANIYRNTADCNTNGIDDDGNGYVDDCYGINTAYHNSNPMDDSGHGTHVAGTIGAAGNNGIGVAGVNWQVQIMACKFLDSGGGGTDADAIDCLQYFATMKDRGVNLVATNNSWGSTDFSQALMDAIDAQRQRGILFIAAAGNSGKYQSELNSHYPANYDLPNIIAVAASDHNDALAEFSNYGRHRVHVAAPGVDILSTVPVSLYGDPYRTASGTSMAAPHVTGVAALLKADDPNRDWKTIKNLMLAGSDVVPGVAETISGRRLNAYGAMTCSNSVLQSRLLPMEDESYVVAGDSLTIRYLNINCAASNGPPEVLVDGGPEKLIFADDGVAPDQEANDGVHVARRQWLTSEIGDHTLTFPNNEILTVHVLPLLAAYTYTTDVPYSYREIEGTSLDLFDDDTALIRPPFPIQFGGVTFPALYVNSNGNVTFSAPFIDWENTPLPATRAETLVALFWDDLWNDYSGLVHWGVVGSAPNRELVVDWVEPMSTGCYWADVWLSGKFQLVFFEGSSDILFNYANVMLTFAVHQPGDQVWGCLWDANAGASATVGVQSMANLANQFSFDTPSLSNNFSILWRVGQVTPVITQLSPVSAAAGSSAFTLHVKGRGFLPEAVIRRDGLSLPTTYVNAGELTAEIAAGDVAVPATMQITVFNPGPNGSGDSVAVPFPVYAANPVPTLTSVVPDTFTLLRNTLPLAVTGSNFTTGSVARWNGADRTTTVLTTTQLQVTPTRADLLITGPVQLTVFNPAPGGGSSNALPINIINPAPQLRSLMPRQVGAGERAFTLGIGGEGFTPASVVRWNGSDRATTFVYDQYLRAAIAATDVAAVGTAEVTVFTPSPGGGTSGPFSFTIVTPPANDKFGNATVISNFPSTFIQNPIGATAEASDPQPFCNPSGNFETLWFTFTPPAGGGFVTADTIGSNYFNFVSAWSGSPGNLLALGCGFSSGRGDGQAAAFATTSTAPIYLMISTQQFGFVNDKLVLNLDIGSGFRLDITPTSNTVARGSPATFTVTLTPQFGSYNDLITLDCRTVSDANPPWPPCTLSQSKVTPGATAASVTLTVNTANVARLEKPGEPAALYAALSLPLVGLLAAGTIGRNSKKAKLGMLLAGIMIATLLALQLGCGGGSSGAPTPSSGAPIPSPAPAPLHTRDIRVVVAATSGTIVQGVEATLHVTY